MLGGFGLDTYDGEGRVNITVEFMTRSGEICRQRQQEMRDVYCDR